LITRRKLHTSNHRGRRSAQARRSGKRRLTATTAIVNENVLSKKRGKRNGRRSRSRLEAEEFLDIRAQATRAEIMILSRMRLGRRDV
jgi:hypothetical protein